MRAPPHQKICTHCQSTSKVGSQEQQNLVVQLVVLAAVAANVDASGDVSLLLPCMITGQSMQLSAEVHAVVKRSGYPLVLLHLRRAMPMIVLASSPAEDTTNYFWPHT